jgi:GT2 family glycosyltransferase
MTEVSVDVVIFAFNNRNIIDVCLKSICNQSYKNFKCYIVDDHSADGTPEYVEEKYKDVIVYQKGANTGLGESRNIGLALSNAKYVAFLDSDVEIDDDWLKEGIKMMEEDPNVAICASKLFFASAKDRVNSAGGTLHPFGFGLDIGKGKEDHFFRRKEVLFACGAAMLLRRESIQEMGGFDETFFYGFEDADVGWRANMCGHRVIFNPSSIAYHRTHGTVRNLPQALYFHGAKSMIRMLLKNYQMRNLILFLPPLILVLWFDILLHKNRRLKLKGIFWNMANLKRTLKERKRVQSLRIKKDKELFNLFIRNIPTLVHLIRSTRRYRRIMKVS